MSQSPDQPKPITPEWLFRAAAHYLERYSATQARLGKVLERKVMRRAALRGDDPAQFAQLIDATVARFVELKLLDDRIYAESKLATLRRRGTSTRMTAAKLAEAGVDRDLTQDLLSADEVDERSLADAYVRRRRLGPYRLRQRLERRDRDVAALVRAGFPYPVAAEAVDAEKLDDK